ncbi:MAG: right-handed parallel beta-helix repeat-containing protein [Anaerolineae bacterium]
MKRVCFATGLLVLFLLTVPGARNRGVVSAATADFPTEYVVVYVGHDVVDLRWDKVMGASSYRLERNPGGSAVIQPEEMPGDKLFYRDSQAPGTELSYRVCAISSLGEDCSEWVPVQVGQVQGHLYKNDEWADAEVELAGIVDLEAEAILKIGSGAMVSSAPGATTSMIRARNNGRLWVQPGIGGAGVAPSLVDIGIEILGSAGDSIISGGDGKLVTLDGVAVVLYRDTKIEYCDMMNGSVVYFSGGADQSFLHNQISAGTTTRIEASAGELTVSDSTFAECTSCILLRPGTTVTVTRNSFRLSLSSLSGHGIRVAGANATIKENEFQFGGGYNEGPWAIDVQPNAGGTVNIEDNAFLKEEGGLRLGRGITTWPSGFLAPDKGSTSVEILGNVFRGLQQGLYIRGSVHVEARDNGFTENAGAVFAMYSEGLSAKINHNCIVGNGIGLEGPQGVDATGNWWGSPDGPTDANGNPPGGGDVCKGGATCEPYAQQDKCSRQARDLWICHIEPNQGIQTYDNAVPIVAGKPAEVRVYPASTSGVVSDVGGELVVRRGGVLIGTRQPEAPATTPYLRDGCFDTPAEFTQLQRGLNNSLNFKLPKEWVTGTLTLSAEVNPDEHIEEFDYQDNTKVLTVTTRQARPVRVGIRGVYPPDKQRASQQAGDAASMLDIATLFGKVYPAADVTLTLLPTMDWPYEIPETTVDPEAGETGSLLLNALSMAQMRLRTDGTWEGEGFDQVFGVVAGDTLEYTRPDPVAEGGRGVAAYSLPDQVAFAHALGLNLGHDPKYSVVDPVGYWGYDLTADRLVSPDTTDVFTLPVAYFDSAQYSPPFDPSQFWVSSHIYNELLDYNLGTGVSATALARTAEPQTYVLVGGIYDTWSQKATFSPAWQVTTAAPPANPSPSPYASGYCVQLRDAGDDVLSSHCFYVESGYDTTWSSWGDAHPFLVSLPLSGTPARVVFLYHDPYSIIVDDEWGSLAISANAPAVTITGGAMARESADAVLPLTWSGQDADGDTLAYSIFYSADNGATWRPVAANLTVDHYDLDLAEVPGGAKAWVRVEVSDGFHTASDTLGPFTVDDHGPLVTIAQPEAGSVVSTTLSLLGYAYDHEEGELTGAALVWASDLAGELGTGSSIVAEDLVTGTHRLTLTATDSQGHSGSAFVLVGVETPVAWPEETYVFLPITLRR